MEPVVRVPPLPGAAFRLPPQLEGLRDLAYNLYWGWHPDTKRLFNRIDPVGWSRYRNPIQLLSGTIDWSELLDNPGFLAEAREVLGRFDAYMQNGADHWYRRTYASKLHGPIAYFCAEYGLHEALGIYSGGLGVLAGDHMKAASDMALPVIGVGLVYRKGYFRQTIDWDGHQEHAYPDYDLTRLPIRRAAGPDGEALRVTLPLPDRDLADAVWLAQVGRGPGPLPAALATLRRASAVILAPSNPFVSLGPIFALRGVRSALRSARSRVAAISPSVGGTTLTAHGASGAAGSEATWNETDVLNVPGHPADSAGPAASGGAAPRCRRRRWAASRCRGGPRT